VRRKFILFSIPYFARIQHLFHIKRSISQASKYCPAILFFVTCGDIAVQAVANLNVRSGYSLFTHPTQSAVSEFEEMKMTNNSVFVADEVVLYSLKATSVKSA